MKQVGPGGVKTGPEEKTFPPYVRRAVCNKREKTDAEIRQAAEAQRVDRLEPEGLEEHQEACDVAGRQATRL